MPCHSCGFQGLIITCYLATLVNRGCPPYHLGNWVFSMCSFLSCQQCHEFLLYILVTTIEVVNCFSAYGLSQHQQNYKKLVTFGHFSSLFSCSTSTQDHTS